MSKNIYTDIVDNIKAPDEAVGRALESVKNHGMKKKEKIVFMKSRKFKYTGMLAACLAIIIAAGSFFTTHEITPEPNLGNTFVFTVNAAEITENSAAYLSTKTAATDTNAAANTDKASNLKTGDPKVIQWEEYDNGTIVYNIELPLTCKGENIKTVTYSVDKGAISVNYYINENPVLNGVENNEFRFTPEIVEYKLEDMLNLKMLSEYEYVGAEPADTYNPYDPDDVEKAQLQVEAEGDTSMEISSDIYDPAESIECRHYSSITLDYNNQKPEGVTFALVGSSSQASEETQQYLKHHKYEFYTLAETEKQLEERRLYIEKLLDSATVHCTVDFEDGTSQTQDIKLSAVIMNDKEYEERVIMGVEGQETDAHELPYPLYFQQDVYIAYSIA